MQCRIALYVILPSVLVFLLSGAARAELMSQSVCSLLESHADALLPNPADPVENVRYTPQNPSGASRGLAGDFVRVDLDGGWCLWMRRGQRWPWSEQDTAAESICGAQLPDTDVRNYRNAFIETYEPYDAAAYHGKIPLENVLCSGGGAAVRNGGNGHASGADPNARHRR